MLQNITYRLAGSQPTNNDFGYLAKILSGGYLIAIENSIALNANSIGFQTRFELAENETISGITLGLKNGQNIKLAEILFTQDKRAGGLNLQSAAERLAGHIAYVDHTGVIFTHDQNNKNAWEEAKTALAKHAAVYEYPNGYDGYDKNKHSWLFALPASDQEITDGITNFNQPRHAAFEMVRDSDGSPFTILQVDLQTNLSRTEILQKFPEAFQVSDELGKYFCSVWVQSPWHGINIRLDLHYKELEGVSQIAGADWRNRKFLVQKGQRI